MSEVGHARQVFADDRARDGRGNGTEGASYLFGGGGLGVPGIDLTLSAAGVDDQDGTRLAEAGNVGTRRRRPAGQRQANPAKTANPQPFAPGQETKHDEPAPLFG